MIVHTCLVGNDENCTAERHAKGQKEKVKIACPPVVKDYALNMNSVDKADRERRDISVIIRSNKSHLRI